jgi:hypothetical protein
MMKKKILILNLLLIAIVGCQDQSNKSLIDNKSLRDNAAIKFEREYQTYPWLFGRNMKLMRPVIEIGKEFHNPENKATVENLKELREIALSVYDSLNIDNSHINDFLSQLKISNELSNDIYLLEYVIINDLLLFQSNDKFEIDNIVPVVSYKKISKDSLELIIQPNAEILYYNPLITVNGQTIGPNNLDKGKGTLRVSNNSKELKIDGSYKIRKGTSEYEIPIDTILKIKN